MDDTIIVALVSFVGVVFTNLVTHSKTMYRIEQLEKKQDKHNNVIERMYNCEKAIDILHTEQKNDRSDIEDLRKRM